MTRSKVSAQPSVAVVGGGINGLCCAWQLSLRGASVTLFEAGQLTGGADAEALHLMQSGLHSLGYGDLRVAREALLERSWWLQHCPEHCREIDFLIPIYAHTPPSQWLMNARLATCHLLSGLTKLSGYRWMDRAALLATEPELKSGQLLGGFSYSEVRMDEPRLGEWVAQQARAAGAQLLENVAVERVHRDGSLELGGQRHRFTAVVNATGPQVGRLLERSGLRSKPRLAMMRCSQVLLAGGPHQPCTLQTRGSERYLYVQPHGDHTLIGSTERLQGLDDPVTTAPEDIDYLLKCYNRCFTRQKSTADVVGTTSGIRPMLRLAGSRNRLNYNYLIERQQGLLTVYGGQWTTARALGAKVADNILP